MGFKATTRTVERSLLGFGEEKIVARPFLLSPSLGAIAEQGPYPRRSAPNIDLAALLSFSDDPRGLLDELIAQLIVKKIPGFDKSSGISLFKEYFIEKDIEREVLKILQNDLQRSVPQTLEFDEAEIAAIMERGLALFDNNNEQLLEDAVIVEATDPFNHFKPIFMLFVRHPINFDPVQALGDHLKKVLDQVEEVVTEVIPTEEAEAVYRLEGFQVYCDKAIADHAKSRGKVLGTLENGRVRKVADDLASKILIEKNLDNNAFDHASLSNNLRNIFWVQNKLLSTTKSKLIVCGANHQLGSLGLPNLLAAKGMKVKVVLTPNKLDQKVADAFRPIPHQLVQLAEIIKQKYLKTDTKNTLKKSIVPSLVAAQPIAVAAAQPVAVAAAQPIAVAAAQPVSDVQSATKPNLFQPPSDKPLVKKTEPQQKQLSCIVM